MRTTRQIFANAYPSIREMGLAQAGAAQPGNQERIRQSAQDESRGGLARSTTAGRRAASSLGRASKPGCALAPSGATPQEDAALLRNFTTGTHGETTRRPPC